jgi:5-methylcytosine-specific restriction endonuclease McrA
MGRAYHRAEYQRNRLAVLEAAGWRCQIRAPGCTGVATTADHVQAVSLGGGNAVDNLRAACRHCNSTLGVAITNEMKAARRLGRRSRRW